MNFLLNIIHRQNQICENFFSKFLRPQRSLNNDQSLGTQIAQMYFNNNLHKLDQTTSQKTNSLVTTNLRNYIFNNSASSAIFEQ